MYFTNEQTKSGPWCGMNWMADTNGVRYSNYACWGLSWYNYFLYFNYFLYYVMFFLINYNCNKLIQVK